MFSKIKNLFAPAHPPAPAHQEIPFQHPKMGEGDASECPFIKNKKENTNSADKCPVSGQPQQQK